MKTFPSSRIVPPRRKFKPCVPRGFTLVEVMVVVAILAVLGLTCLCVVARAKRAGQTVKELNAARNLTAALTSAAIDKNGTLPYGVDGSAASISLHESGLRGVNVTGAEAHRYPFRLAPYFGYMFENIMVLDKGLEKALKEKDTYMMSLAPSLGINAYGVGGYVEPQQKEAIPGAIRTLSAAVSPEKMIAFASARVNHAGLGGTVPGFHMITPRLTPGGDWSREYKEDDPTSWGNVDLRNNEKLVAGFLDGSAGLLTREQVKDMRYWNNEAARLNDPNHRPVVTTGGGRDR